MRKVLLILALFSTLFLPINSSVASNWLQYESSPADLYNSPDLRPEFDITGVDFGVSSAQTDEYWFFINFAKPVTSTLFADGQGSWAMIMLDTNLDGKTDYSLQTDDKPYVGNYFKEAEFVDRTTVDPVGSTLCKSTTWTNTDKQASWIGFSVKKSCPIFSSSIKVSAYSDYILEDKKQFDYANEGSSITWQINLSSSISSNPRDNSSSIAVGQLPYLNSQGSVSVTKPSSQPTDLVSLAAVTTKSVVTVRCGTGIGSGWAINATLSAPNISNGFKSYIITNHHVVDDCLINRSISLILSDQTLVSGYVYSWDEKNDVAGILTSTIIPPLNWRGSTPQQGWWVGALGSPLGFPGILTTGIVSSVNTSTFLGTTNTAINPGNSGGPIFDRTGRVIGLATAKYINSEGFGIFHGTPLLCGKIVSCTSLNQIWSGAIAPTTSVQSQKQVCVTASGSKTYYDEAFELDEQCSNSNTWKFVFCDAHPKSDLQILKNKKWQKVRTIKGIRNGCSDSLQPYEFTVNGSPSEKYRIKTYGSTNFSIAYMSLKTVVKAIN